MNQGTIHGLWKVWNCTQFLGLSKHLLSFGPPLPSLLQLGETETEKMWVKNINDSLPLYLQVQLYFTEYIFPISIVTDDLTKWEDLKYYRTYIDTKTKYYN